MERRDRRTASLGLALTLTLGLTGCRTPRSEIPPSKTFSGNGQPTAALPFGSTPNPVNGFSALPSAAGDGLPGQTGAGQLGTPGTNSGNFGVPSTSSFGPPGTNLNTGAANPSSPLSPAGMNPPSVSNPTVGIPQTGTGPAGPGSYVAPTAESPAPSQLSGPTPGPFQQ